MDDILKRPIPGDTAEAMPGVVQGFDGLKVHNHYLRIQAYYLEWLNSFNRPGSDDTVLTPSMAWPDECQVLSVTTTHTGLEEWEVWVLTWGTGDEGGPALLVATFHKLNYPSDPWDLQSIIQQFDTSSSIVMVNGKLDLA